MKWVTCRDCRYGWVECIDCQTEDGDREPNCWNCGGYGGWECLSCEGTGEWGEEGYDDDD